MSNGSFIIKPDRHVGFKLRIKRWSSFKHGPLVVGFLCYSDGLLFGEDAVGSVGTEEGSTFAVVRLADHVDIDCGRINVGAGSFVLFVQCSLDGLCGGDVL